MTIAEIKALILEKINAFTARGIKYEDVRQILNALADAIGGMADLETRIEKLENAHYSALVGNGDDMEFTISHMLGTNAGTAVVCSRIRAAASENDYVGCRIEYIDTDNERIIFGHPPGIDEFVYEAIGR